MYLILFLYHFHFATYIKTYLKVLYHDIIFFFYRMTSDVFETTRLMLMVLIVAVRFVLMPHYLQSYLNMAPEKLKDLRKEAGRISNVELQKMVCSFLCLLLWKFFYKSAKDML